MASFDMSHIDKSGEPIKRVKTLTDMSAWTSSMAYYDLVGFINATSIAIQGKRISDKDIYVSPTMSNLLEIFGTLHKYIDSTPPTDQPQRFGNQSYRTWSRRMNQDIFLLLQKALPQEKCEHFSELGFYLAESFGNAVRIDYGTGHELSFIFFLCGLFKSGIFTEADTIAAALKLFNKYLIFVRRLQKTYNMEPAGSQGVWALDDYQFIPFIWGSAQLSLNSPFDPVKFLDENVINEYKNDYMFIGCIDYICQVKTGHFAEHSNQLWSISAVQSWSKINNGLVKMYQKEILAKFPIIQHVLFGKLMSFEAVKAGTHLSIARLGFPLKQNETQTTHSTTSMGPPPVPPPSEVSSNRPSADASKEPPTAAEISEALAEFASN